MGNILQGTGRENTKRQQKIMQCKIKQLYTDFAYSRIGGVSAKSLPHNLQSLAIEVFKTPKYVNQFAIALDDSAFLTEQLCILSLEIPDDNTKNLAEGFWEDVVHQLKQIIHLWLCMDRVLAKLAREQLGNAAATSVDGMKIIQDDKFAVSLLKFMEMLNLFPGDKYLDQIGAWCHGTESLISVIHKTMGREMEPGREGELQDGSTRGSN